MSYHQVTATSLTPSRPAPQAPFRQASDSSATMYNTNASLASSGYNSSFLSTPSSPSVSSYTSSYTGIGGSPNRNSSNTMFGSQVVRAGQVYVKEDGFASWIWKAKWLILKEDVLTIHKSEVGPSFHIYRKKSYSRHFAPFFSFSSLILPPSPSLDLTTSFAVGVGVVDLISLDPPYSPRRNKASCSYATSPTSNAQI